MALRFELSPLIRVLVIDPLFGMLGQQLVDDERVSNEFAERVQVVRIVFMRRPAAVRGASSKTSTTW